MVWVSTLDELAGVWTGEPAPLAPAEETNLTDTTVVFILACSYANFTFQSRKP